MTGFEEEDLTSFRLDDLLAVVDEVAANLGQSEDGLKLRKVSKELRKRNSENPKPSGAAVPPRSQVAVRPASKEVPSRTKGLREPPPPRTRSVKTQPVVLARFPVPLRALTVLAQPSTFL